LLASFPETLQAIFASTVAKLSTCGLLASMDNYQDYKLTSRKRVLILVACFVEGRFSHEQSCPRITTAID
jgi:hypothetical protein